jgi:cytochrome c oxidase assembly protein subunit 15
MIRNGFDRLALLTLLLAYCVIVLGAYVRLSHAGLGCPDWPGCYGLLDVPSTTEQINQANAAFPERPVEIDKAWKEMIHRYLAGVLGLAIFGLALLAWRGRHEPDQTVGLPIALTGLVVFQALLGMWTVTLLLKPLVVMAHLLGGLATLALLWLMVLRRRPQSVPISAKHRALRPWAAMGLILVILQVALGGWTSANYAALACPDFPTCQTQWWPPTNFEEAFILWRGTGVSYEGGVLDNDARVTIHLMHRLGAVAVLVYLIGLAWHIKRTAPTKALLGTAAAMLTLLGIQLALGTANVVLSLPLPVAVAHNGVAALLILALITLNHLLYVRKPHELRNSTRERAPSVA